MVIKKKKSKLPLPFTANYKSIRNYSQVWQLFLLYRVDHELFGFSPRRYLEWAKK